MTTKISGTDGIDVAQLRAPDGDPVAITIGNDGKVAFPAMSSDISSNGSIEFPGGLIMKWGFVTTEVDGPATVNFPTAFPNACLNVTGTVVAAGSSAGAGQPFLYNSPSVSSVMIGALTSDTGGWASRTVFWQALGN